MYYLIWVARWNPYIKHCMSSHSCGFRSAFVIFVFEFNVKIKLLVPYVYEHWARDSLFWRSTCDLTPLMWSETVSLRTRPVSDQKIGLGLACCGLGLGFACHDLGLACCGLGLGLACYGLGLAGLMLCCETRSCHARRHNDLEGHKNFSSTIYSFSVLCLEHRYCGDQLWCSLTSNLNPPSAFVCFQCSWSWSCYFGLDLVILVLVLFLRIWSCLRHWHCWLCDRKGLQPVKHWTPAIRRSSLYDLCLVPGVTSGKIGQLRKTKNSRSGVVCCKNLLITLNNVLYVSDVTRCTSGCVVECRICSWEVAGSNLSLGYFAPSSTQPSIPPGR